MKKLVLLLIVTTSLALGAKGQSSTASGQASDAADKQNAVTGKTEVSANGQTTSGQASSVQDNGLSDVKRSLTIEKKGCFRIASLSLASGMNKYRELGDDEKDWGRPDKDQQNQSGQHGWSFGNMGSMMGGKSVGNGGFNTRNSIILEMGLNPWSKKMGNYNKKRELTIGLFYSGSDLANRYSKEFLTTAGDTFSFNGVNYQTDTVARIQKSYVEKANVLGVGVQYLFRSDPEKRISVFAGVGIDAAYALTARIRQTYTKDSALVLSISGASEDHVGDREFDNGKFLGNEETKTTVNAKTSMFASVYLPFGIDFKLCKKKDIWNQFSLFLKGNLGLETAIVVGSKTHFNPYMGAAIGLKFDFK